MVADGRMTHNAIGGQSILLSRDELLTNDDVTRVQWLAPDAKASIPVDLTNSETLFGPLRSVGVHWIRGGDQPTGVSVNIPPDATRLDQVGVADIRASLAGLSINEVNVVESVAELELRGGDETRPTPISSSPFGSGNSGDCRRTMAGAAKVTQGDTNRFVLTLSRRVLSVLSMVEMGVGRPRSRQGFRRCGLSTRLPMSLAHASG